MVRDARALCYSDAAAADPDYAWYYGSYDCNLGYHTTVFLEAYAARSTQLGVCIVFYCFQNGGPFCVVHSSHSPHSQHLIHSILFITRVYTSKKYRHTSRDIHRV